MFAHHVARLQIKEAIPVIKELLKEEGDGHSEIEFAEALEQLETGVSKYPDTDRPFCQTRSGWEEHYASVERCFYDDEPESLNKSRQTQQPPPATKKTVKVGRNDPCLCGSGKKYKKCCLTKDEAVHLQASTFWNALEGVNIKLLNFFKAQDLHEERLYAEEEYYCLDPEEEGQELPEFAEPITFFNWFLLDYRREDGSRLIDLFLSEYQNSLSGTEKQVAALLRESYPSLFEVTEVTPAQGIRLTDSFTDKELSVPEKEVSRKLPKRLFVTARVITFEGRSYIVDTGPTFTPMEAMSIVEMTPREIKRFAKEEKTDISLPEFLKNRGGLFFNMCYFLWEELEFQAAMNNLRNSDGDKMELLTAHYKVLDFDSARTKLTSIPSIRIVENSSSTIEAEWIEEKGNGPMEVVIYGDIRLTKERLSLECNSKKRLKKGKKLLSKYLGKSVKHQVDEIENTEKLMEEILNEHDNVVENSQLPVQFEAQRLPLFAEEYYRNWLDEKQPALNGKTPRQAAKSDKLRGKLNWLLKDLEYEEEQNKLEGNYSYNVNKLRQELGL